MKTPFLAKPSRNYTSFPPFTSLLHTRFFNVPRTMSEWSYEEVVFVAVCLYLNSNADQLQSSLACNYSGDRSPNSCNYLSSAIVHFVSTTDEKAHCPYL